MTLLAIIVVMSLLCYVTIKLICKYHPEWIYEYEDDEDDE